MSYLLRFPNFKAKAVTFSYDDGSTNDRRLVKIFNDHGLKATFNLNSGRIRTGDEWSVCEDELLDLYRGHEIAVHGVEHLVGTATFRPKFILTIFSKTASISSRLPQNRKRYGVSVRATTTTS
ncbi:MAG: polysaccharide deacetylase family protein [Christensenellales bacterium]